MTEANGTPPHARTPEGSTSELVRNLAEQVSRLIRDELKLAEYELARKAKRFGRGAGMFGGSGLVAFYGVGCLLAAAIIGLALVLPAVAGLAALAGRSQVSKATPPVPEQTVRSVQADVAEIKERAHR
jgi:hypothetical protein